MNSGPGSDPLDIAVIRGILAPFAHVPWSAIMAGAFWLAMKKNGKQHSLYPAALFLANCRYLDRASHVLEQSFVDEVGIIGLMQIWDMCRHLLEYGLFTPQ